MGLDCHGSGNSRYAHDEEQENQQ